MLEYYDNKLCISKNELVDQGYVSQSNYNNWVTRKMVDVARSGRGKGNYALVVVDSLPNPYRDQVKAAYPDADAILLRGWVLSNYEMDQNAVAFFHDRSKTGLDLDDDKKMEYIVNASVLNCCLKLYHSAKDYRRLMGERYDWEKMAYTINLLKEEMGHTLPTSTLRFRKKANAYEKGGYITLISGKFGNQNNLKVDFKTEQLVVSLAVLPNKPYKADVHEMYNMFVCGELDVWDIDTGEVMPPDDYCDKNGEPKTLSETTIRNIMNKPSNQLRIKKKLMSWDSFYHEEMPWMHRHAGEFSLSQITMDDVDLPRRMKGGEYVHAYYAYDVVSQCRVGLAYGRKKDERLVTDCFRDMFRLIAKNGWGIPASIEVEQHLMSQYKEGFLKAGEIFRFVRFCAPQNSQEKYAEALNGAFKTTIAHKNHEGIGRWYNKGARRVEQKKVSDETNHTWEDKRYYSFEELVADDRRDCYEWNHSLHPNQKKYPGMTRWDVLVARINPDLQRYDDKTLCRYIGECRQTRIRRNSTVSVAYKDWWISSPEVLERLQPNNRKVTAYYMPTEDGDAERVFIYQDDKFIDELKPIPTYNRNMAEQTEADKTAFAEQQKYVAQFKGYLKEQAIANVRKGVLGDVPEEVEEVEVLSPPTNEKQEDDYLSYDFGNMDALGRSKL